MFVVGCEPKTTQRVAFSRMCATFFWTGEIILFSIQEVIHNSYRVVVLFCSYFRGGLTVCGDAVLLYFWCSFAEMFVLTRGIAVSKRKGVCCYYNFWVVGFGEKNVCTVLTLFRTMYIQQFCKGQRSVLFYNALGFGFFVMWLFLLLLFNKII